MSFHFSSRLRFLNIVRIYKKHSFINYRSCNSGVLKGKKLEDYFFNKEVQRILKKITGLNYDKIFPPKQQEIVPDQFEFATEEKLKEMFDEANAKAAAKLQMPPVMDVREPINEVLDKDPNLQFYLQTKLLFIDTSANKTARNRIITVRETDGTLRKADWDERFRMNQIFFPLEGRSLETPKFFESPQFDKLLDEEEYEFILESACVQFEPDDPEYHKITKATYEHMKNKKKFDILRSTRHFGPMAFYFAMNNDINPLLIDMLERQLIGDAADTIKLLNILHPEPKKDEKEMDDIECVKDYVQRNRSSNTANLELALQTFLEVQSNEKVENASL